MNSFPRVSITITLFVIATTGKSVSFYVSFYISCHSHSMDNRNNFLFIFHFILFAPFFSFLSFPSIIATCSLTAQMPAKFRKNKVKPRGVSNRNRGLEWIRSNASEGVLYFADDDNTYDLDIFDEVRIEQRKLFPIMKLLFSHSYSEKALKR